MNKWIVALVMFFAGGLLGWGIATANVENATSYRPAAGVGGGPVDTTITPTVMDQEVADLQLTLNNLLREHSILAVNHLQAIYDGKDTEATSRLLDTNGRQLTDVLSLVYGSGIRNPFLDMWGEHMDLYMVYTQALKNNDKERMDQIRKKLEELAQEMGTTFNTVNKKLDADTVSKHMSDHIALTLNIIDAYVANDQVKMVSQLKSSADQATQFAAYLSQSASNL